MRAYTFTLWQLRAVAQGIQPAHCLIDMFTKYREHTSVEAKLLYDWAENHKTMICLNGGTAGGLKTLWEILEPLAVSLQLPVQKFHEDEESLCGMMTSVGVIVTEDIYTYAAALRSKDEQDLVDWYMEYNTNEYRVASDFIMLAKLLNQCSLAT